MQYAYMVAIIGPKGLPTDSREVLTFNSVAPIDFSRRGIVEQVLSPMSTTKSKD